MWNKMLADVVERDPYFAPMFDSTGGGEERAELECNNLGGGEEECRVRQPRFELDKATEQETPGAASHTPPTGSVPPQITHLSDTPAVRLVDDFLSPGEAAALLEIRDGAFARAASKEAVWCKCSFAHSSHPLSPLPHARSHSLSVCNRTRMLSITKTN